MRRHFQRKNRVCLFVIGILAIGEHASYGEAKTISCLDEKECRASCDRNELSGCLKLVELYERDAPSREKNAAKLSGLYQKLCQRKQGLFCFRAGEVAQEPSSAFRFFQKGCDENHGPSCWSLSLAYEQGRGGEQNREKADAILDALCQKDPSLCVEYAEPLRHGSTGKTDDVVKALKLYRVTCKAGVSSSCYWAGHMFDAGKGTERDSAQALQFYDLACEGNDAAGCYYLAEAVHQGKGTKRDFRRAMSLYEKACAGGHRFACGKQVRPPQPTPNPTSDDIAKAKQLWEIAQAHYTNKEYDRAVKFFLSSYQLSGKATVLFNAAQCYEQLEQLEQALVCYERYAQLQPDDQAIQEKIKTLLAKVDAQGT